jgi:hypothetical protein
MKLLFFIFSCLSLTSGYIQSYARPNFCLKNTVGVLEQSRCPKKYDFIRNSDNQLQIGNKCLCNNTEIDELCCNTVTQIEYDTFTIPDTVGDKCLTLAQNMSLVWKKCENYNQQKWMTNDTYYENKQKDILKDNEDIDYNYMSAFDYELMSYYLYLNWDALNKNIRDEEYIPCRLRVNHLNFFRAGCRYKGSYGSLHYCLKPNSDERNGICNKLSIKVDPNYFETNKKIRNMKDKVLKQKKLLFHGMGIDQSLFAEKTSYTLLNELGIASPKAVYSKLFINDTYSGVYLLVQNIDDEFTESHFESDHNNGKGALYKDLLFNTYSDEYFSEKHISGRNENGFMLEVAAALLFYNSKNDAKYILDKYFDVDTFAKITAFNSAIGNIDDWQSYHNFYWYVREKPKGVKKLVMIPWDYDRIYDISLVVINNIPLKYSYSKWWSLVPTYFKEDRCFYDLYHTFPITCDLFRCVLIDGEMKEMVNYYLDGITELYVTPSRINSYWENWKSLIENDISTDPTAWDRFTRQKAEHYLFGHILKHRQRRIPLSQYP